MIRFALVLGFVPFVCGRVLYTPRFKPDERIVGGRNATIEEFPYQLSIELYGQHWCGATLIKRNIALSAAHCTEKLMPELKEVTVRTGSTVRESGGQVAGVLSIAPHPKYKFPDYDVSVLHLDRSFDLSSGTQLIALQPVGEEVPAGQNGTVTGWGATAFGGEISPTLQAVEVPRINDKTCSVYYPDENITTRMACYGYEEGGRDACQGDSGGPLARNGKLIGITSWGYACAFPKWPNVYTRISNSEIQKHINDSIKKFQKLVNS